MRKAIAILLAVLFIVTVTASAVSAAEHAGRKTVTLLTSISIQSNEKPILDLASLQVGPMGPTPFPSISDAFRPSNKEPVGSSASTGFTTMYKRE